MLTTSSVVRFKRNSVTDDLDEEETFRNVGVGTSSRLI